MKELRFMMRFDQKGKEYIDEFEFYRQVSGILIKKQIATHVTQRGNHIAPLVDGDIVHVEMPYAVRNDIFSDNLTMEKVISALSNILDIDSVNANGNYSNLQITEE